ncbi:polysaccharide biosynthesis/export family protein [Cupriavidus necator]|uniref:polysaccharide biosynthesis/export family protein n=1 Tax=Cupriavidus necator TaxID=106590 RepID=UPI003F73F8D8
MPAQQDLAAGDLLDITIWEAPPAALFGGLQAESLSGAAGGHATQLPTQVIDAQGNIMVPFVGRVRAAGRSVAQVAAEISQGLNGRANRPQVLVRLAQNQTSFVTVISDAGGATRVPFTPKSERLLDAISSAGGGKQQLDKLTVQITRGNLVRSMPLSTVIKDPRQNIRLFPGDTVALLFKPNTFGSSPICVTV